MTSALVLLLVVGAAYLAAHVAFDWLGRRFLIVSGAEYLILGILLGPQVSGFIRASAVDDFAPFMTLSLGWIGALLGSYLYLPLLVRTRSAFYRVAFAEALLTFGVVSGVMAFVLAWLFQLPVPSAIPAAIAMGAIATASSPSGIALLTRRLVRRGVAVRQIEVAIEADAIVAITAFSLLLCVEHVLPPAAVRPPTPTEWAVIGIAIGIVGGTLVHLFVGEERHSDRLFISLAGAITLVSGASAYLRLSPLLSTMLMGAILINTSRNRDEIRNVLSRVARPFYFVLLIFAGAAWAPQARAWWAIPAFVFIVVRFVAKMAGARLAARLNHMLPAVGPNWGLALIGQGELAIAIALNYHLVREQALLADVVFTVAVLSVLLTDLSSARLVHSVVRRYTRRTTSPDGTASGEYGALP